ncbi:MAG: leucine-rich repeat domain-containing protein [Bacteroidia bacterium]
MWRWTKVAFLLGGWVAAQEEVPTRLVVYDDLLDRFFQIKAWSRFSSSIARPDTLSHLRLEGEVPDLSRFPNLQALYLSDIEELDLPTLITALRKYCPKLRILALEDCDIEDVSPILELRLQGLLLDGNPIQDFTALQKLSGLQFLSLARTPLREVSWLSSLATLRGLDLSETAVTDLSPLSQLPQLRMIALYKCSGISTFTPLTSLPQIEFLNISFTNPAAVQPFLRQLTRFTAMKVFQAQGVITDPSILSQLSQLSQLEELTLGQNPAINNLEFVRPLKRLLYLDVHRCSVKDLSPLAGLPLLVKLSIGKNQVTSIAPLTQCPRLQELYCYDNPIEDWEKLLDIPSLSYVMVSKREVSSEKFAGIKPLLRKKGIRVDAP